MDEAVQARISFALETNLANPTLATRIPRWQEAGYTVSLVFVWILSADLAVERFAARVRSGGHDIPEATIRRRYKAGLHAFFEVYQPLVDNCRLYDNSGLETATLVAERRIRQPKIWKRVQQELSNEQP